VAALLCLAAFLAGRQFNPGPAVPGALGQPPAEVEQFWRPVLEDGRPLLVSLGTPMFVRMLHVRIRVGHEELESAKADPRIAQVQKIFQSPSMQASHIYTGVGEATAAFELARLFTRWKADLHIRRNSVLTWEDISSNNLIILGSAKYNPQIRRLPVNSRSSSNRRE
jgi:hypothetical protein